MPEPSNNTNSSSSAIEGNIIFNETSAGNLNNTAAVNSSSSVNETMNDTIQSELMNLPLMYNDTANTTNETLNELEEGAQCDGGTLFADPNNPVLQPPLLPAYGVCIISAGDGSNVAGWAKFTQLSFVGVKIELNVTGLPPNSRHGFHLSQFGDMLGGGCYAQALHYNPLNMSHGGPFACERNLGDAGNIQSDANGTAYAILIRPEVSLIGPYSFLGKGCVIHTMADDYGLLNQEGSVVNGHAGGRIGCGVIGSSPIPGLDY